MAGLAILRRQLPEPESGAIIDSRLQPTAAPLPAGIFADVGTNVPINALNQLLRIVQRVLPTLAMSAPRSGSDDLVRDVTALAEPSGHHPVTFREREGEERANCGVMRSGLAWT